MFNNTKTIDQVSVRTLGVMNEWHHSSQVNNFWYTLLQQHTKKQLTRNVPGLHVYLHMWNNLPCWTCLRGMLSVLNSQHLFTWKSLKITLPSLATISSKLSKYVPSVVSLYGAHRANVRKSNMEEITSAPVPRNWNRWEHLECATSPMKQTKNICACYTTMVNGIDFESRWVKLNAVSRYLVSIVQCSAKRHINTLIGIGHY